MDSKINCKKCWKDEEKKNYRKILKKNATCTKWALCECRWSHYKSTTSWIKSSDWYKNADAFACTTIAEFGHITRIDTDTKTMQSIWIGRCATSLRISSTSHSTNAINKSRTSKGIWKKKHTKVSHHYPIKIDIFTPKKRNRNLITLLIRNYSQQKKNDKK